MIRRFGKFKYIQTWEIHQSGFPHLHLAVANFFLWDNALWDIKNGLRDFGQLNFDDHIKTMAVECFFGWIGWLEPIRTKAQMAGYLSKLAREISGAKGKSQIPVNAPPHFRRLRASPDTLPPRFKNPDIAGLLEYSNPDDKTAEYFSSVENEHKSFL